MKPTRRSPVASRRSCQVLLIVAVALLGASCGPPINLQSVVDEILRLDQYGGAAARIYGTPRRDALYGVAEHDLDNSLAERADEIYAVGLTDRPTGVGEEVQTDGFLLRLAENGVPAEALAIGAVESGVEQPYDEEFRDVEILYGVEAGGDRVVVAGHRTPDSGPREGLILRLQPTVDGLVTRAAGTVTAGGGDAQLLSISRGGRGVAAVGSAGSSGLLASVYAGVDSDGAASFVKSLAPSTGAIEFQGVSWVQIGSATRSFVAAGHIADGGGTDAFLVGVSDSGAVESTLRIDAGGNEYLYAVHKIISDGGEERFVAVGSTDAYFNDTYDVTVWFVVVFTWDAGNDIEVEMAVAVRPWVGFDMVAFGVNGINSSGNVWERDDIFAVVGNGSYAALMDISGNVLWVSGPALSEEFFSGSAARDITAHDFGADGFYVVGQNEEHPDLDGLRDGYLSLALPPEGESEPFTEDKGDDLNYLGVYGVEVIPIGDLGLATNTTTLTPSDGTWTPLDVAASYGTLTDIDDLNTLPPLPQ